MFKSLDELDTAIVQSLDDETDALFLQGDTIISGIEGGFSRKTVYGRFSYYSRKGERTAKQRHKVSAIFTADKRNPELNWSMHSLCASVADLRKPETWDKAYQWLDRAAGLIADGREYSTDDLLTDMKAVGDNPEADKPEYLIDKELALITSVGKTTIELSLANGLPPTFPVGVEVVLTVVRKVLSEEVKELHKQED